MKRFAACLFLGAAAWWLAAAKPPAESPDVKSILAELSDITGLQPRRPVESSTMSRAALKRFLEDRIREDVKPEDIRAEELMLKAFGLAPSGFDLKTSTVDLLTEQAAAFYDFHKKCLFVLKGAPESIDRPALVHELAHALADQHFNLEKFVLHGEKNDDESLARMAVMEGQATWLMSEEMARKVGSSLANSPQALETMARTAQESVSQYPVFDKSPLYLKVTLLFPYTQGMMFQQAVYQKMGQAAFAEVFRHPPVSTQQILQPKTYFDHLEPLHPKLPALPDARDYRKITSGTFGELDHSILIRQYGNEKTAGRIAPHWRGGSYAIFEPKKGGPTVLSYAVEWDSPKVASEYFHFYRKVLAGKWKHFEARRETATELSGTGDNGAFEVHQDGVIVFSLEGLKPGEREGR